MKGGDAIMLLTRKQKRKLKNRLHKLFKYLTKILTFIKLLRDTFGF